MQILIATHIEGRVMREKERMGFMYYCILYFTLVPDLSFEVFVAITERGPLPMSEPTQCNSELKQMRKKQASASG